MSDSGCVDTFQVPVLVILYLLDHLLHQEVRRDR